MRRNLLLVLAIGIGAAAPASAAVQRTDTLTLLLPDTAGALGPRLSLDTVIARTATYSPSLDSATGVVRTSKSAQRVALGAYLPSVGATGIAGRSNQGFPNAVGGASGPAGFQGGGVAASLDLFTGGQRTAVRHLTQAALRAADAGLISQRYVTRLQAMTSYFDVLRGHELVRVGIEAVSVAQTGLNYANARGAAGAATPSDVLRAQLQLSTAQRILLASQDTLLSAAAALGRLVGSDGLVDAEPMDLEPSPLALSDSAIVYSAVHDAPIVQQTDAQVQVATAAVRAAKAQYAPVISATGGYTWANNGSVVGAPREGWIVAVGASFPLFNGFVREDSVTRAKVTAKVAQSSAADTRRLSRSEAIRLLGSLHVAEQDLALTIEAVRVAGADLRVISSRYRAGIATMLDLTTSQQALVRAELDEVSARFTYQTTRATLEALLGRDLTVAP